MECMLYRTPTVLLLQLVLLQSTGWQLQPIALLLFGTSARQQCLSKFNSSDRQLATSRCSVWHGHAVVHTWQQGRQAPVLQCWCGMSAVEDVCVSSRHTRAQFATYASHQMVSDSAAKHLRQLVTLQRLPVLTSQPVLSLTCALNTLAGKLLASIGCGSDGQLCVW